MKTIICPICKSIPDMSNPFKTLDMEDLQIFVCSNCGILFNVIDDLDDVVPEEHKEQT